MKHQTLLHKKTLNLRQDIFNFLRNFVLALIIGAGVGAYASVFGLAVSWAGSFRTSHQWLFLLLPVGGLAIIGVYYLCREQKPRGTNRVLESISANEKLPIVMAPLISVGTFITHLVGGSAGREGAALQIGGCLGANLGRLFRLEQKNINLLTMCGMSAAFAALFGTPLTATIFVIEVVSIGIMHYSAIVPCAISAIVGLQMAKMIGLQPESFSDIVKMPDFDWLLSLKTVGFGILCALLSILFCQVLHKTEHLYSKYIPNPFLKIVVGSILIIAVTMAIGNADYQGVGMNVVEQAMEGHAVPYAFALKMILTALTLGAGFKGGEIVPTIFIGATFGAAVGPVLGIDPSMAAALGVCGLFCAVTNCPLASLALAFEMFGFHGVLYFLIVAALCYRLSGYYGLYSGQKIVYSKSKPQFIGRFTNSSQDETTEDKEDNGR